MHWSDIELDDLYLNFGGTTVARGEHYYESGRVLSVKVENDKSSVSAIVRGSLAEPYYVNVTGDFESPHVNMSGHCSCPVAHNCKHVVAVLFWVKYSAEDGELNIAPNGHLAAWLREINDRTVTTAAALPQSSTQSFGRKLYYVLDVDEQQVTLECVSVTLKKSGQFGQARYVDPTMIGYSQPKYMNDHDMRILSRLTDIPQPHSLSAKDCIVFPRDLNVEEFLSEIIGTGRCVFHCIDHDNFLTLGEAAQGDHRWIVNEQGDQTLKLYSVNSDQQFDVVLPCAPPFYIKHSGNDGETTSSSLCGPIQTHYPASIAAVLSASPQIAPDDVVQVRESLEKLPITQPAPLPQSITSVAREDVQPQPHLTLGMSEFMLPWDVREGRHSAYGFNYQAQHLPVARLSFSYDQSVVNYADRRVPTLKVDGQFVHYSRDEELEQTIAAYIQQCDLAPIDAKLYDAQTNTESNYHFYLTRPDDNDDANAEEVDASFMNIATDGDCLRFVQQVVPLLEASGIQVDFEDTWMYLPVPDVEEWFVDVNDGTSNWFKLGLGVVIEGESYDLAPVISEYLQSIPPSAATALIASHGRLVELLNDVPVYLQLSNNRRVALPVEPMAVMLRTVLTLFVDQKDWRDITHALPPTAAALLLDAQSEFREGPDGSQKEGEGDDKNGPLIRWRGGTEILALGERLKKAADPTSMELPEWFDAELRDYQKIGVTWMSALSSCGFGGVLADDMGLGKTIQAIARLCQSDIVDEAEPTLVIAPTSVVRNWEREIQRFAPRLSTFVWHGKERHDQVEALQSVDVIITTYALLRRDKDMFTSLNFSCLIIDEAQAAKNPRSNSARTLAQVKAKRRYALTGTPLENNLDELWAMFSLVIPGMLGTLEAFRRQFRTPIERHGDVNRRDLLSRRISPFLLRRTKEQVAKELPEKIIVTQPVTLGAKQAAFYESIRLSCDQRVRQALREKGLAKSRITVLDALLKLRQACCDPTLVKLETANDVVESAKREYLSTLISTLVAEGRRILVFSQFVQMLQLIDDDLEAAGVPRLKLTGRTRNRQKLIDSFQNGDMPVFLISLKAGGVGLNLTGADTVILYDPWWNPATEAQAIDRTHRIGQTNTVFVYRLIAENTVEAGISELQQRKSDLARSLLDDSGAKSFQLSETDIAQLFAPIT